MSRSIAASALTWPKLLAAESRPVSPATMEHGEATAQQQAAAATAAPGNAGEHGRGSSTPCQPAQQHEEGWRRHSDAEQARGQRNIPVQQADDKEAVAAAAMAAAALPDEDGEADDDPELAAWLARTLQRLQPGAELTVGSVRVLGRLLDEITVRVLDEAQRINSGGGGGGGGCPAAGPEAPGASAAAPAAAGRMPPAAAQPQHPEQQRTEKKGRQQEQQQQPQQRKPSALTSLDIHKVRRRRRAHCLPLPICHHELAGAAS